MNTSIRNYILLSIPIFVIHAIEELYTNFHEFDELTLLVSKQLSVNPMEIWVAVQVLLALLISLTLITQKKVFVILFGLVFVLEVAHVVSSVATLAYTSGLITSLLLLVVGALYWRSYIVEVISHSKEKVYGSQ